MLERLTRAIAAILLTSVATPVSATDGAAVYANVCAACHGADGSGQPGLAPPLANDELWKSLGDKAGSYAVGVVLSGLTGKIEAKGQSYIGLAMPPHSMMTDEEIAAVVTYVLATLNHMPFTVAAPQVAEARAAPPGHAALRALRKGGQ